jgi:hypothetical protein
MPTVEGFGLTLAEEQSAGPPCHSSGPQRQQESARESNVPERERVNL